MEPENNQPDKQSDSLGEILDKANKDTPPSGNVDTANNITESPAQPSQDDSVSTSQATAAATAPPPTKSPKLSHLNSKLFTFLMLIIVMLIAAAAGAFVAKTLL